MIRSATARTDIVVRAAERGDDALLVWAKETATEGAGAIMLRALHPDPETAAATWRREAGAKLDDPDDRLARANWLVAEQDGQPLAAMLSYTMDSAPEAPADAPAMIRPILSLMAGVPGSLYIDSIAVRPEARGRGLARALMTAAERRARAAALPRLTLIALSSNHAARPLYFDLGFADVDGVPLQGGEWAPTATHALLMRRDLPAVPSATA